MAEENDEAEGEDASSLGPTQQPGGVPPERPDGRPDVDEDAIIREGIEARRHLGRQVAKEALADPGGLTPERLRRLGPEGLQRFVVELRCSALGVEQPSRQGDARTARVSGVPKPPVRSPSAAPPASAGLRSKTASAPGRGRALVPSARTGRTAADRPTPPRVLHPSGSIDATSSGGWWRTDLHEGLPFEQWAIVVGLFVGALATFASLIWLARTRF